LKICGVFSIKNDEFSIKLDMLDGTKDVTANVTLLEKLESTSKNTHINAITDIIYSVRCNIFHGQKQFKENQLSVLKPVTILLEKLVNLLFNKLKNE
jgi:hypothetical protein